MQKAFNMHADQPLRKLENSAIGNVARIEGVQITSWYKNHVKNSCFLWISHLTVMLVELLCHLFGIPKYRVSKRSTVLKALLASKCMGDQTPKMMKLIGEASKNFKIEKNWIWKIENLRSLLDWILRAHFFSVSATVNAKVQQQLSFVEIQIIKPNLETYLPVNRVWLRGQLFLDSKSNT